MWHKKDGMTNKKMNWNLFLGDTSQVAVDNSMVTMTQIQSLTFDFDVWSWNSLGF